MPMLPGLVTSRRSTKRMNGISSGGSIASPRAKATSSRSALPRTGTARSPKSFSVCRL
jgi:hypothetical protein